MSLAFYVTSTFVELNFDWYILVVFAGLVVYYDDCLVFGFIVICSDLLVCCLFNLVKLVGWCNMWCVVCFVDC